LKHQRVLESQVIAPVDQQLVLEVLRWVKVFARRLLTVAPTLQTTTTTTTKRKL
jgi:hypothetical protein